MIWNWINITNNEDVDSKEDLKQPYLNEIHKFSDPIEAKQRLNRYKLHFEIRNFDDDDLNSIYDIKTYFYNDLLQKIRIFDKNLLNKVYDFLEFDFITELKYELECRIVENRLKTIGLDPGFSYSKQEYKTAYSELIYDEWLKRYRRQNIINFTICIIFGIFGIISDNKCTSGIYLGLNLGMIIDFVTKLFW